MDGFRWALANGIRNTSRNRMSSRLCVPSQTENPLRLAALFRDYWGEQMASFTEAVDFFAKAGCYVPRFFHAPDAQTQLNGIPPNGYLEYLLSLPIGSFILGYLHTTSSVQGSGGTGLPPNLSGFTMQVTDLSIDHKWFSRPAEEAYFVNDQFVIRAGQAQPYTNSARGYTFPSCVRLLPKPYPVVAPGQFMIEFWNALASYTEAAPGSPNTDVQMTFLVMVPDGVNQNARNGSGK